MENWGARRAAFRPYFFLSFILGSRVRNPAQSAGLTGDAAAIAQSDNVELTGGVGHLEGSKGVLNELMTAEILLGVTLVDGHLAGAGDETDAGDGVLTTAGTLVDNGVLSHL